MTKIKKPLLSVKHFNIWKALSSSLFSDTEERLNGNLKKQLEYGIKTNPVKLEIIKKFRTSKTSKELRPFLVMSWFYIHFIKYYPKLANRRTGCGTKLYRHDKENSFHCWRCESCRKTNYLPVWIPWQDRRRLRC